MSFRSPLGPPTPEQEKRWDAMRAGGCIVARMMATGWAAGEIHHLTVGGKHGAPRLGHDLTICLSPWSHRGIPLPGYSVETMEQKFGPSYARTPRAFRREFGGDQRLLDAQQDLLGLPRILIPTRRERASMTTKGSGESAATKQIRKRSSRRKPSKCVASSKTAPRDLAARMRGQG